MSPRLRVLEADSPPEGPRTLSLRFLLQGTWMCKRKSGLGKRASPFLKSVSTRSLRACGPYLLPSELFGGSHDSGVSFPSWAKKKKRFCLAGKRSIWHRRYDQNTMWVRTAVGGRRWL